MAQARNWKLIGKYVAAIVAAISALLYSYCNGDSLSWGKLLGTFQTVEENVGGLADELAKSKTEEAKNESLDALPLSSPANVPAAATPTTNKIDGVFSPSDF